MNDDKNNALFEMYSKLAGKQDNDCWGIKYRFDIAKERINLASLKEIERKIPTISSRNIIFYNIPARSLLVNKSFEFPL